MLGALLVAACSDDGEGAGAPSDASTQDPARQRWGDFDEGRLRVTFAGTLIERCVLVADSSRERATGLMDAPGPDLGGYDGMAFVWGDDQSGGFWMKDTEVPLSIAYISAAGDLVSTADMAPCPPEDGDDCPVHLAQGPYRMAVEVPLGELASVGIQPGAVVSLEPGACPA